MNKPKQNAQPPRWLDKLLERFCAPHLLEEVMGDLHERYQLRVKRVGEHKAKRMYFREVLAYLRPSFFKREHSTFRIPNPMDIFRNYFIIAFRNVVRNKSFSLINIFGLSIGMSVCLLMLMVIKDLFSYDSFHPQAERTFRITTKVTTPSQMVHYARSPLALGNELKENYPVVENVVRIYPAHVLRYAEVKHQDKELPTEGAFADATFFDVFGFTLSAGNPLKALTEPFTIVLTQETATRFFGNENAIGEVLTIGTLGEFKVTGVLENPPVKTHLHHAFYASMSSVPVLEESEKIEKVGDSWKAFDAGFTYVLLREDAELETLTEELPLIASRAMETFEFNAHGTATAYTFDAQPLEDIMPTSLFMDSWAGMSLSGVLMFSGIALAILLIAGFNYTNLSVARSLGRAKEVGIRKVTGATRTHIFAQFLSESVLFALFALLLGFFLTKVLVLHAGFSRWVSGIEVDTILLLWFVIFSICVGVLAGALPALLFSKINSIQALKNLAGIKLLKVGTLRKSLIVIQFSISMVFVIVLLVVYRQSAYVATADNGYHRENIISIDLQGVNHELASSTLAAHAQVEKVTAASANFGLGFGKSATLQKQQGEEATRFTQYSIDTQFIPAMGLTLQAGQNLPRETSAENSPYVILNEKALQVLGLGTPAEAIGEALWLNDSLPVEVIGVVKDFHYLSLKHPIGPLVLQYHPDEFNVLNLKVSDPYDASFRVFLQESWKEIDPLHPLEYYVYEDQFYDKWIHAQDTTFMGSFAFMAIFIACMGLLGMVMYSMETRIKEIGIRKVIGAGIGSLAILLSKDFFKLIVIAAVFALPLGYGIGNLFLQEYAYRITLGAGLLSVAFGMVLLLGLIIVSSQTIKAALANPVDSLRNE